ncbi:uncharacterized protein LOC112083079 [Eutrema salsugineum]|uniref:uncharacterized protein LOC112083079 n=1 Tax=Eutrema salsugineum TaxID=72664 RepID=UPI000CED6D36|nr:uncharacterized protein LOC112083079 [Eutrema salsugineum]
MLKQVNTTAIALIPKRVGAERLEEFRPISCCTTVYKVISRILSAKLKLFVADVIQGNQVGFIKRRLLCENVLLASELVADFLGDRDFWALHDDSGGSWIWRRLLKLRSLARPFLCCTIGSGRIARFWTDNWSDLGPLIELTGANGPRITGIHRLAVVSDDLFLWKHSPDGNHGIFSSSKTWAALNPPTQEVTWWKSVWFSQRIPKHSFIHWVAMRDRLPTRNRLRSWGMNVPAVCLLCQVETESRDHLFFSCSFAQTIWSFFFGHPILQPPQGFDAIVS